MSKLLHAMKNKVGTTLTENGALTLNKSGSKVLDFYSKGGSLRSRSESDVIRIFNEAFDEDALLALKTLFYLRDVRQGQGERRLFRVCLKDLAKNKTESFVANIGNIVEFGRWDDLFEAFDTPAESAMVSTVKKQLGADFRSLKSEDSTPSLLAKWMPSANTSSAETRALAQRFIKAFKVTPKKYRKTLSAVRKQLNLVESAMSSGKWSDINFEHVPSKANLVYKKAFSKHQPDRYTAFIKAVQSGEKKMNASTLYPYEFGRELDKLGYCGDSAALDALWKSLPDFTKDNPHNGLVMADVSGSMTSDYGTGVKPIWVSISLAIYFAQKNTGLFKDHFLTFSEHSELVKIRSKNISTAWRELSNASWGMSTNLQSAFDTILAAAVENKVPASEMPQILYVISDMEFNVADRNATNFEVIEKKYKAAGYKRPVICFWNVAARKDQSPVKFDQNGTILVSGCSPSIFSQVISGKNVTPYDFMLETLNKPRYNSIVVS